VGLISEGDVLVKGGGDGGDQSDEEDRSFAASSHEQHNPRHAAEEAHVLRRLEGFYVKLWMALRSVVRSAFAHHTDVLEAGTYVQVRHL
jgi:hypothetical protein